jgi:HK97 gp10 family phage protein
MARGGMVGISLDGDEKLMRKLRKVGKKYGFDNKEIVKALRPSARAYQQRARQMVPRDTGALWRSIKIKKLRGSPPALSVFPKYSRKTNQRSGKVTSGYHAHLVEFGTKQRPATKSGQARSVNIGGRWVRISTTGAMSPQPFLAPAYQASKTRMIRLARVNFWKMVLLKTKAKGK